MPPPSASTQSVCVISSAWTSTAPGSTLSINGIDVGIVEAFSGNGMRMIITLFLVCYVVAFTVPLRWWVRIIFLALSPIVAIICNVVRLVPTVYLFGNAKRSTAETFHDISGWAMSLFAFGFLILIFATALSRLTSSKEKQNCPPAPRRPSPVAKWNPLSHDHRRLHPIASPPSPLIGLVAGRQLLANHRSPAVQAYHEAIKQSATQIPSLIGPWAGEDVPVLVPRSQTFLAPNIPTSAAATPTSKNGQRSSASSQSTAPDAHDMVGHYPPAATLPPRWVGPPVRATGIQWTLGGKPTMASNTLFYPSPRQPPDLPTHTIIIENFLIRVPATSSKTWESLSSSIMGPHRARPPAPARCRSTSTTPNSTQSSAPPSFRNS